MSTSLRPPAEETTKELLRLTRKVVGLEKKRERLVGQAAEVEGQLLQARRHLRQFVQDLTPTERTDQAGALEDVP